MTEKVKSDPFTQDEFDLIEIILILWKRRLLVLIVTAGFSIFGVAISSATKPLYEGKIDIHPLTTLDMAGFDGWNQITYAARGIGSANANVPLSIFTPQSFMREFQTNFSRNDAIRSALKQHSKSVGEFKGTDEDLTGLLTELAKNYKLESPEAGQYIVKFTTRDKVETLKILHTTFQLISEDAKREIIESIRSKIAAAKSSRDFELDVIDGELKAMNYLYERKKQRSIILMQEQASIARSLGLKTPTDISDISGLNQNLVHSPRYLANIFESDQYLRGYQALELQIKNLEYREEQTDSPLMNVADQIIYRRALLLEDRTPEKLEAMLSKLPLQNSAFRIARIDLTSLEYETKSNRWLALLLAFITGFGLSTGFVLVGHFIQARKTGHPTT